MRVGWEIIVDGDEAVIRPLDVADLSAVAAELISVAGVGGVKTTTDGSGIGFVVAASVVALLTSEASVEVEAAESVAEPEAEAVVEAEVAPARKRRARKPADVEVDVVELEA